MPILYLSLYLSIHPPTYPTIHPSVHLSIHPSISCYSHLEHRAYMKCYISLQFLYLIQSIGLFGWGISLAQGHYLPRTTDTQNKHRHPCLEWDSNPRFQCSSEQRHFMPLTVWSLWSAHSFIHLNFKRKQKSSVKILWIITTCNINCWHD
jgi:hypothetical protein